MIEPDKLRALVNQSGFPLQIGVARLVNRSSRQHGWRVLYQEHSWKNQLDNSSGFIDLVFENQYRTCILLVECKRVLETSWTFLIADIHASPRRHAKAWVTRHKGGEFERFDWYDLALDPESDEATFCVVPGQDSRARPMLERLAAELVSATEGLAEEERFLQPKRPDAVRMYFPVIVTTANLSVCRFDGDAISISDGKLPDSQFQDAPYVRFRKQLSTQPPKGGISGDDPSRSLAKAKERTVFVVNSGAFASFLAEFRVDTSGSLHLYEC
jgi:hypothetical protein